MKLRTAGLATMLLVTSLAPFVAGASWHPDAGDWPTFRRDAQRGGLSPAVGAFSFEPADLRVKWSTPLDPAPWVPPVAADLDGDGVAEVAATVGNVSIEAGAPPTVNLASGVVVLDGATGGVRWKHGPTTGNLALYSPTLGDIDGDGKGDVVFLDGNPLTGTFATNKVFAYSASGQKKWEFSDAAWGDKTPLPFNSLAIGDVDGESTRNEVVAALLLAKVDVAVSGNQLFVNFSQTEHRILALNGEGAGSVSWQRQYPNATLNSPVLGDLDGDGVLDVAWGSGIKPGAGGGSVSLGVAADAADDHVRALAGGATPRPLWNFTTPGYYPGEIFAPTLADLDGDGLPEFITGLLDRTPGVRAADVLAVGSDGAQQWRTRLQASGAAPLASGDLDGDGRPEVVGQTSGGSPADANRVIALAPNGTVLWRSAAFSRAAISAPALGDLTGDGQPEVAVLLPAPSNANATLVVLDGRTGAERFRKVLAGDGLDSLGGPVLADLDGDDDGRVELLLNFGELGKPGKMVALEPELPDLVLRDLAFGTASPALGQPVEVTVEVLNAGSRWARNASIELLDSGSVVAATTLDLAPGASQTLSFSWTPAAGGPRSFEAVADRAKALPEWSEEDNAQSAALFVRAPDLRLGDADPRFSDPAPSAGDTITVSATVRNVGHLDAGAFRVRFFDDGAVFADEVVEGLPAGASVDLSAPLRVEGEHLHTVRVVADADDAVAEEDETDGAAERQLNVRFLAPDLAIAAADIAFADANPDEFDTLLANVTVHNQGSAGRDAAQVVVRLLDGPVVAAEATLDRVPSGGSAVARLAYPIAGVGPRTLTVRVDPDAALVELNETNNAAQRGVVVGKVRAVVALGREAYALDEEADGLATLTFRSTGKPLASHEFTLPVEYVVPLPPGGPQASQALAAAAALLASAGTTAHDHVRVCAGATCVDGAFDEAAGLAQVLGAGASAGEGLEATFRLATLELRTNKAGQAAFRVPHSTLGALDALRGAGRLEVCAQGPVAEEANAVLVGAGQAPLECVRVAATAPALPGAADLPGDYRATIVVDWHGFPFTGSAAYRHEATLASPPGVP